LPRYIRFTDDDQAEIDIVHGRLRELSKVVDPHPNENLGEAQSIIHARRNAHYLVAHDGDAQRVARENGVPATTIVSLAREIVATGGNARELADAFISLQSRRINTGYPVRSELDLTPRRRK
jgi:hypothetical protein